MDECTRDLLAVASFYGLPSMVREIERKLVRELSAASVLDVFDMADMFLVRNTQSSNPNVELIFVSAGKFEGNLPELHIRLLRHTGAD